MYKTRLDITDQVFRHLTAIEYVRTTERGHAVWKFRCACGKEIERQSSQVTFGNTGSCGCATNKLKAESKITHGISNKPEYSSYRAMISRCYRPSNPLFHRYGGRGIKICERWLGEIGPANFFADMGARPTREHSIDRIDNDGDYTPENCRWATRAEQAASRSTTRLVTVDGVTKNQAEWDRDLGNGLNIVGDRIRRGWDKEVAIKTPPAAHSKPIDFNGKSLGAHAWELELGLGHGTIAYRIKKLGWSVEKALTTPSRKRVPLKRDQ